MCSMSLSSFYCGPQICVFQSCETMKIIFNIFKGEILALKHQQLCDQGPWVRAASVWTLKAV